MQTEKICCDCKIIKKLEDFTIEKNGQFGRRSNCRKCNYKKKSAYVRSNIKYRLSTRLRIRLYHALKAKNWTKNSSYAEYLGCSQDQLKRYLENQFTEEMNWNNYGKYWEIDHIIPLNSAKNDEELYALCKYSNLKPLTVSKNRSKGAKI